MIDLHFAVWKINKQNKKWKTCKAKLFLPIINKILIPLCGINFFEKYKTENRVIHNMILFYSLFYIISLVI